VRKKIEQIEVCEFDEKTKERTISHINIRSRLVLSGVTLDHVRLFGNKECLVSFGISNHVTDQEIEVEAHRLLCDEMGADPRDLSVNLQSALMATMPPKIQDMNDVQVKVVPPSRINLGSLNMGVQFWHDDKILVTRFAVFSVRKRHRVAIAKASLSKAVPLGEQSIDFEERFLATPADELTFEQISGRSVKSVVQAGAIIQLKDLQSSETGKAVVIRKGDNVKVAAVIGSLRVEMANAEAVQDGGLGDFINLKNRETGKTIVGEVKARGRVLIEL
jgi:flagella basal body P-ring formation protein FlgA